MKEININKINGIKMGQVQDIESATGCTVIISEEGAIGGVDVRGGGPATCETDLLRPTNMIEKINAVVLSGGSAYGLSARSGVMQYLEEKGFGFDVGVGVVPIVCAASLFDLSIGDARVRPTHQMGYEACKNAEQSKELLQGNYGAGTGATVGKMLGPDYTMKSGIGHYAVDCAGLQVGAIVAVNALGDVFDEDGKQIAGLLSFDQNGMQSTADLMYANYDASEKMTSTNTTIGCIITNGIISKSEANKVASVAHNGLARAINPIHTSADGDAVFVMATNKVEVNNDVLGTLAAEVMRKAIINAVNNAEPAYNLKSAQSFK